MGLFIQFHIIFGSNILTKGPVQIVVLFCLFQCFAEKEYQTESKRNETIGRVIFGTEAIQETWSRRLGSFEEATRQGGVPYPLGAPPPSWAPRGSPDQLLSHIYIYIPIYPKTSEEQNRSRVPPPEGSVATESQSRPIPTPVAIFIIPMLSMTRRD